MVFRKDEWNTAAGKSLLKESFEAALNHVSVCSHPAWNSNENSYDICATSLYVLNHRLEKAIEKRTIADIICGVRGVIPTSRLAQYGDYRYSWLSIAEQTLQVEDFHSSSDDVTRDIKEEAQEYFSHPSVSKAMKLLSETMRNCLADVTWDSWLLVVQHILMDIRHFGSSFHSKWQNILINICAHFLEATRWNPNLNADIKSEVPLIINYEELHLVPITKEELLSIPHPCQNGVISEEDEEKLWKQLTSSSVRKLWYDEVSAQNTAHLCPLVAYALGMSNSEVIVTNFLKSGFVSKPEKINSKKARRLLGSLITDASEDENPQLMQQQDGRKNESPDVCKCHEIPVKSPYSNNDTPGIRSTFRTGLFQQNSYVKESIITPSDSSPIILNEMESQEPEINSQSLLLKREKDYVEACLKQIEESKVLDSNQQQSTSTSGSSPDSTRSETEKSKETKLELCCNPGKSLQDSPEKTNEAVTHQSPKTMDDPGSPCFKRTFTDKEVSTATSGCSHLPGWPYTTPPPGYPFVHAPSFTAYLRPLPHPQNVGVIPLKIGQPMNPLCAPPTCFPPPMVGLRFPSQSIPAFCKWHVPSPANLTLCQRPPPQFHPLSSTFTWTPDSFRRQEFYPPVNLYRCPRQISQNRETTCTESAKRVVFESVNTNCKHSLSVLQSPMLLPVIAYKQQINQCTMTLAMYDSFTLDQRAQAFDQGLRLPLANGGFNTNKESRTSKVGILPLASLMPIASMSDANIARPLQPPVNVPYMKTQMENTILSGRKKSNNQSVFNAEETNHQQRELNDVCISCASKASLEKISGVRIGSDFSQVKKIPGLYKILLRETKAEEMDSDVIL